MSANSSLSAPGWRKVKASSLLARESDVISVSIIIPTFREAANLEILVTRIVAALNGSNIDAEIIIVDDNSADGTEAICAKLGQHHAVRLHTRTTERGLSSAVLAGLNLATGERVLVMDADLSHPPEKIPQLIRALDEPDVDFVIGSRYVKGGSTASDWGMFRWLNSKIASLLAWPLTPICDPMAGFFALRRQNYLDVRDQLDPIGYKIGLELLVKCRSRAVVEIPISFEDRLHGQSKLTVREQVNYLRHLRRLYNFRFGIWAYLCQFLLVGATGMAVDLASFATLLPVMPIEIASAMAIWIAMTWNFWFNRLITFSFSRTEHWFRQYLTFCAGCSLGALINWTTRMALIHGTDYFSNRALVAAVVGVVAGTLFNFTLCRVLVFRKQQKN